MRTYTALNMIHRLWPDKFESFVYEHNLLEKNLFPWINSKYNINSFQNSFHGRGLATTASKDQLHLAYHSILNLIYIVKTQLPIEVIFLGRQNDLNEEYLNQLSKLPNVTVTNINKYFNINALGNIQGFNIKPFVILASKFKEVIFFDADAVFFRDPIQLFYDKGYKLTGTLFYHDRYFRKKTIKPWKFLRNCIAPYSAYAIQSDIISMDVKRKNYQEMESGNLKSQHYLFQLLTAFSVMKESWLLINQVSLFSVY